MSEVFTPDDALNIAYDCMTDVSGSARPLDPTETLERYNIHTDEQVLLVKNVIRSSHNIGLPAYGRAIDPNALKDLANDWTLQQLADVIFVNSMSTVGGDSTTESDT